MKVSVPQFAGKSRNSRVVSEANFRTGILQFESSHLSQPVPFLNFLWQKSQESLQMQGILNFLQSPRFRASNQNSQFGREISRIFLGNSRFAESKSGDWFDSALSGRGNEIRTAESHFRVGKGKESPPVVIMNGALRCKLEAE